MSDTCDGTGCAGSCPVCHIGEVSDHKCSRCGTTFCPVCHGTKKDRPSKNVLPCRCKEQKVEPMSDKEIGIRSGENASNLSKIIDKLDIEEVQLLFGLMARDACDVGLCARLYKEVIDSKKSSRAGVEYYNRVVKACAELLGVMIEDVYDRTRRSKAVANMRLALLYMQSVFPTDDKDFEELLLRDMRVSWQLFDKVAAQTPCSDESRRVLDILEASCRLGDRR